MKLSNYFIKEPFINHGKRGDITIAGSLMTTLGAVALLAFGITFGLVFLSSVDLSGLDYSLKGAVQLFDELLSEGPFEWLLILTLIFIVWTFLQLVFFLVMSLLGYNQIVFNKSTRNIYRNRRQIAKFSDIDHIQFREILGEHEKHTISLINKDDNKYRLAEIRSYDKAMSVVDELSDLLGVSVITR